ncbi:MAG: hypothetical protein D6761_08720, partial [Candidatus Dadabacteria bacterium]
ADREVDEDCTVDTPRGEMNGRCVTARDEETLVCAPGRRSGHRPSGPPPEAFEACADREVDEDCTVDTPRGEMKGRCVTARGEGTLVCAPGRRSGHRPSGPPPEAFEACADREVDEDCTVDTPRGEMDGRCVTARDEETLVCVPRGNHGPEIAE